MVLKKDMIIESFDNHIYSYKKGDKLDIKYDGDVYIFEYPDRVQTNKISSNWYFSSDKNKTWYIWDYFYTKRELRNIKLKEIGI